MNTNTKKYVFPAFIAIFALMLVAATPYVIAESNEEESWTYGGNAYDHTKKGIKVDMTKQLNNYCEMSSDDQTALIEKHSKTDEMVAKMDEYCSLDKAGKQAFIEEHKDEYRISLEEKMNHEDYLNKHPMIVEVEGFMGAIIIPELSEETDMKAAHDALRAQVTVKLSEAADAAENSGLDVMQGSIGMTVNEYGDKSLAWILTAMNMDSEKMSTTMFIVDAVNITNTAQVTKEFDHSMMMKDNEYLHDKQSNYAKTLSDPEQIQNEVAKIEEKLSKGATMAKATTDNLKSQFLDLLKQLQMAIADDDDVQADSIREQLSDLRKQMTGMKRQR